MRRRRERGAAMIETVLVTPILFVLMMGMLEVGVAWRDSVTVSTAARNGARTITQLSTNDQADREGLRALEAVFAEDADRIQLVVVFQSDGAGQVPTSCLTASSSICNRYGPAQLGDLADAGFWGCGGGHDASYCPSNRENRPQFAEYIGVYIEFDRPSVTGVFGGGGYTLRDTAVMRIEPDAT